MWQKFCPFHCCVVFMVELLIYTAYYLFTWEKTRGGFQVLTSRIIAAFVPELEVHHTHFIGCGTILIACYFSYFSLFKLSTT